MQDGQMQDGKGGELTTEGAEDAERDGEGEKCGMNRRTANGRGDGAGLHGVTYGPTLGGFATQRELTPGSHLGGSRIRTRVAETVTMAPAANSSP